MSDQAMAEFRNGMGLLFFIFLILKLIHAIGWSWWFVTMPLWLPFTLAMVVGIVGVAIKGLWRAGRARKDGHA